MFLCAVLHENDRKGDKTSSSTKIATHVGMVSGEGLDDDQVDLSTLDFVAILINGSIGNYTETELSSLFGITQ